MQDFHYPGPQTGSQPQVRATDIAPRQAVGWSVRENPESTSDRLSSRGRVMLDDTEQQKPLVELDLEAILAKAVNRGMQLMLVLVSAVGVLMLMRILLLALNASTTAPFVQFVYDHTGGVVEPFRNMFANGDLSGHPIELNSIVALVVYGIGLAVVLKIIEMFLSPHRGKAR
jgi:hypothetical protein